LTDSFFTKLKIFKLDNPLSGIEEKGENTTTITTQNTKETTISSSSSELPPTENKSEGGNTTTAKESKTSTTTIEEIKEQQQNTTTIITTVTTTLGENETKISNATEPVKVEKRNDNQQGRGDTVIFFKLEKNLKNIRIKSEIKK